MSKLLLPLIVVSSAAVIYASPVMAADNPERSSAPVERVLSETTIEPRTDVMSAIETSGLIPVTAEDGTIYYNHYVAEDELFNPTLELETVETITIEHDGRVYTNKIVVAD
ncbi:hypothetical protein ACJ3XI_00235 [Litorimonas sp. RW-G-Af-16]|uniref:hypothetical protein n=1 Tax=Litorimonas sp. RW-G-Af-16 TaxID=3241168 RepID=UPI00390C4E61